MVTQPHLLLPQQRSPSTGQCEQVAASRCNPNPWEQQDPRVLCSNPPGSSLGLQLRAHNHQSTSAALRPLISHLSARAGRCTGSCLFVKWMTSILSSFGDGSHHEEAAQSPSQGTQQQQQPQPGARGVTLGAGQVLEPPQPSSQGVSTAPEGTV